MSSYFLGGFSAYLIVPSGRQSNHSGCCLIQGWSGAAWIAKSSAISRPCSWAAATRRLKSSSTHRAPDGLRRVPPLGTDRVGAARIVGARGQAVVAALAVLAADRVDGREVEHVEAHVADIGQLADHISKVPCRLGSSLIERGNNSYHAANAAAVRSTTTSSSRP